MWPLAHGAICTPCSPQRWTPPPNMCSLAAEPLRVLQWAPIGARRQLSHHQSMHFEMNPRHNLLAQHPSPPNQTVSHSVIVIQPTTFEPLTPRFS